MYESADGVRVARRVRRSGALDANIVGAAQPSALEAVATCAVVAGGATALSLTDDPFGDEVTE